MYLIGLWGEFEKQLLKTVNVFTASYILPANLRVRMLLFILQKKTYRLQAPVVERRDNSKMYEMNKQ